MKVLVTGGAGFIGSHLAESLWRDGHTVTVLDNFSQGTQANLLWARDIARFRLVEGDLRDDAVLRDAVSGCDQVFHQAGMNSVPRSIENPLESHRVNVDGTLQLLLSCRDAGVRRVVFASSSSIYGDAGAGPRVETQGARPLAPYPLQKFVAEEYCRLFSALHRLETVSLRYFNVFGPRQQLHSPYAAVIPRFCAAMLRGEAPVIFGDGTQARDFTYVTNVVSANRLAMEAPAPAVSGRTFNVASGRAVSLLEIVAELNRLLGTSVAPRFEPARRGDVHSSLADVSAARVALGYAVGVEWQEGLRKTMEFFR